LAASSIKAGNVKLDGTPMGELKTGTYVYADRPAGRHQLSYEVGLFRASASVTSPSCRVVPISSLLR